MCTFISLVLLTTYILSGGKMPDVMLASSGLFMIAGAIDRAGLVIKALAVKSEPKEENTQK